MTSWLSVCADITTGCMLHCDTLTWAGKKIYLVALDFELKLDAGYTLLGWCPLTIHFIHLRSVGVKVCHCCYHSSCWLWSSSWQCKFLSTNSTYTRWRQTAQQQEGSRHAHLISHHQERLMVPGPGRKRREGMKMLNYIGGRRLVWAGGSSSNLCNSSSSSFHLSSYSSSSSSHSGLGAGGRRGAGTRGRERRKWAYLHQNI